VSPEVLSDPSAGDPGDPSQEYFADGASPEASDDTAAHVRPTTPVPGKRSSMESPGCIPRSPNIHVTKARGFRPGRSPPNRAGCALSQFLLPGRRWRPPTTISGSHVPWMPRVFGRDPMGFTQAHTRAPAGQSGRTSRRARSDVESAHPR
jgi:hypothetical protein